MADGDVSAGKAAGRALGSALLVHALLVSGCGSSKSASDRPSPPRSNSETAYSIPRANPVRIVAVGDIACAPGKQKTATSCRQEATAALTQRLNPALVLTLGDHQYENGTLPEFAGSYERTWGALWSRTRPTIGNHEYQTKGASGYYFYFRDRQPGPPGYYRVTAKGWNIYVLNSNCDQVNCRTQAGWLDRQMAAHPSRCSIVTMHHPRYSSGSGHGNDTAVRPLWAVAYKHRNELVLSGHDHDYERFTRMDGQGRIRPTACTRSSSEPGGRTSTTSAPASQDRSIFKATSTVSSPSSCARAHSAGSSTPSTEPFSTKEPAPVYDG